MVVSSRRVVKSGPSRGSAYSFSLSSQTKPMHLLFYPLMAGNHKKNKNFLGPFQHENKAKSETIWSSTRGQ